MDGTTTGKPDGAGAHIWLHYTTQFTVGERTHTIEMDVPVPIGASTEMRERLLREAEAAMYQLTSRVESREGQGPQRNLASQQKATPPPRPTSAAPPTTTATPAPVVTPAHKAATPPAASIPAAQFTRDSTPVSSSERSDDMAVPPTRPNIGASMPSAPGMTGGISGTLTIPQFVQFIKENLGGMTAKQAMDLLKVKTLSGLNLRETLEQLQQIVGRESSSTTTPAIPSSDHRGGEASSTRTEARSPSPPSPEPVILAGSSRTPAGIKEITNAVVRDMPPAYAFDEEIDLELQEEEEYLPELTEQERSRAQDVLTKLRDARGSSLASEPRIRVVHNVIDSQISEEQLQELIQGVWGVTTLKKLKNDQVEALISWAKEDDFVSELEIVLILFQEDQYARSDR